MSTSDAALDAASNYLTRYENSLLRDYSQKLEAVFLGGRKPFALRRKLLHVLRGSWKQCL